MTILVISENQGVKTSIFDKNNFLYFCGPKFQNNVFDKETANCTQFRFLSSGFIRNFEHIFQGLFQDISRTTYEFFQDFKNEMALKAPSDTAGGLGAL